MRTWRTVVFWLVHLCYIDDSGNSKEGVTYTALLIPEQQWSPLLDRWLTARASIQERFLIKKKTELHAVELIGNRGYVISEAGEDPVRRVPSHQRPTIYRDMVKAIPGPGIGLVTVAKRGSDAIGAYAALLLKLEEWARDRDTYLLLMYDGRELGHSDSARTEDTIQRSHAPLRNLHRELPLRSRRIIEDVVTKDSRFSQFIQAADLLAYGAYYHDVWTNPDRWSTKTRVAQARDLRVQITRHFTGLMGDWDEKPLFEWFD